MKQEKLQWPEILLLAVSAVTVSVGLSALLWPLAATVLGRLAPLRGASTAFFATATSVSIAGIALSAALGTFVLQLLRKWQEDVIRYGLDRAMSVAERVRELGKTKLLRLLRDVEGRRSPNAQHSPSNTTGSPFSLEDCTQYIEAPLPENQDDPKVLQYVCQRDAMQLADAARLLKWRSDFLHDLANINTAEPTLAAVERICAELNAHVREYTNQQDGARAVVFTLDEAKQYKVSAASIRNTLQQSFYNCAPALFVSGVSLLCGSLAHLPGRVAAGLSLITFALVVWGAAFVVRLVRASLLGIEMARDNR